MEKDTLENFSKKINSKFFFEYDLKKTNWFNIGGKAKAYFKPDTLDDLVLFLKKFGEKERLFVLKPWNDIAPHFMVPMIEKSISELLNITPDKSSTHRMLIINNQGSN